MLLKKSLTVAATVAASALALAPPASAEVEIRTDLKPGDLVADGTIGAVVPPPGQFVRAAAARVDGPPEILMVATQADGTVVSSDLQDGTPYDTADALVDMAVRHPGECEEEYFHRWRDWEGRNVRNYKWKTIMNWWFRAGSTPSYVDRDSARDDVRRAVRNVVTTRNNCGMTDQVSATQDFQGDTTSSVNIKSGGNGWWYCQENDGKSVVDFGPGQEGVTLKSCTWGHDDGGAYLAIDEADTRMNTHRSWYAAAMPLDCVRPFGRYSIEAMMTRAFTYTYGLEYVWYRSPSLTMYADGDEQCEEATKTLARGDVLGLRSLY